MSWNILGDILAFLFLIIVMVIFWKIMLVLFGVVFLITMGFYTYDRISGRGITDDKSNSIG